MNLLKAHFKKDLYRSLLSSSSTIKICETNSIYMHSYSYFKYFYSCLHTHKNAFSYHILVYIFMLNRLFNYVFILTYIFTSYLHLSCFLMFVLMLLLTRSCLCTNTYTFIYKYIRAFSYLSTNNNNVYTFLYYVYL